MVCVVLLDRFDVLDRREGSFSFNMVTLDLGLRIKLCGGLVFPSSLITLKVLKSYSWIRFKKEVGLSGTYAQAVCYILLTAGGARLCLNLNPPCRPTIVVFLLPNLLRLCFGFSFSVFLLGVLGVGFSEGSVFVFVIRLTCEIKDSFTPDGRD